MPTDWRQWDYLRHLTEAGTVGNLKLNELRVLIVLVAHCMRAPTCWPSRSTICAATGLDPKRVREAVAGLCGKSIISVELGGGAHDNTSRYTLITQGGNLTPGHFVSQGDETSPPEGEVLSASGGGFIPPEVKEHQRKQQQLSRGVVSTPCQNNPRTNQPPVHLDAISRVVGGTEAAGLAADAAGLSPEHVRGLCERASSARTPAAWLAAAIQSATAGQPYAVPTTQDGARAAQDDAYWTHRVGVAVDWAAALDAAERLRLRDVARERCRRDFPRDAGDADPAAHPGLAYLLCTAVSTGRIDSPAGRTALSDRYADWTRPRDSFRRAI